MINIYAMDLGVLSLVAGFTMFVCYAFARYADKMNKAKVVFRVLGVIITAFAIYGILAYTVLYRSEGETHRFVIINYHSHEFFRELFMNGLLYLPLGLGLSVFLGPWVIVVAFLMSAGIEAWQFFAGTGFAQGTDVIMNTLGAAVGVIPIWVNKKMKDNGNRKWRT